MVFDFDTSWESFRCICYMYLFSRAYRGPARGLGKSIVALPKTHLDPEMER